MTRTFLLKTMKAAIAVSLTATSGLLYAQLPDIPVPAENPITEEKRVLGKILFWDEQLSSDGSMACGTCHIPSTSGADPRDPGDSVHPGNDGLFGTGDDIVGSQGMPLYDNEGNPIEDPIFGFGPQVTQRASQSLFGHMWADELFWDGRATSEFVDPINGGVAIGSGGALESQSIGPILNSVEMAKEDRQWSEVTEKLGSVTPLFLATDVPTDMAQAIAENPSYPALFEAAFNDSEITPVRIAFAIASYQRTLVPNQTPFDLGTMSNAQEDGFEVFQDEDCSACHVPPLFTDNDFFNIGLTPRGEDGGRLDISGNNNDRGDMKVPSLRGVGLRETFMHTGEFTSVNDVIGHYNNPQFNQDRDNIPGGGNYNFAINGGDRRDLVDFLSNALTDPRVANETFPFDRPTLNSENPNPIAVPTPVPTVEPTPVPTAVPTPVPTAQPTPVPTAIPTPVPTTQPTPVPTAVPTPVPTAQPTSVPTAIPTPVPTVEPIPVVTPEPIDVGVEMPSLVGLSLDEAQAALTALGLVIDDVDTDRRRNVNGGTVVEQSPAAGTSVTADSDIDITVAGNNNNRGNNNRGRNGR